MGAKAESSTQDAAEEEIRGGSEVIENNADEEQGRRDAGLYMPLVRSVFRNDWKKVMEVIKMNPGAAHSRTDAGKSFLIGFAISTCDDQLILEELMDCIVDFKDLKELKALAYDVALCGKITTAKVFLDKIITSVSDDERLQDIFEILMYTVGVFGQLELGTYLLYRANVYDLGNDKCWGDRTIHTLTYIVKAELYGPAYHILKTNHKVASRTFEDALWICYILEILSKMPKAFRSGSDLGLLERLIYSCIPVTIQDKPSYDMQDFTKGSVQVKVQPSRWNLYQTSVQKYNKIRDEKLKHMHAQALLELFCSQIMDKSEYIDSELGKQLVIAGLSAAKFGNYEVLIELLKLYPPTVAKDIDDQDIFNFAVLLRHQKIFSLVYHSTAFKNVMIATTEGSDKLNILHHMAKLPDPSRLSGTGALLQMQREMQWFQVADSLVLPANREGKAKVDGVTELLTPRELFTKEHKELKEKGEKMVESTAQSGTIVAALIATVAFAAAVTVPAGVNQDTGLPFFLGVPAFLMFAISDAMGFFSSITSVMAFTVILTSPTSEEDFLFSLPLKLIMGLVSLSFSAACIMVAFCATLYIVLSHRMKLIFIPVSIVAVFPIAFFVFMQLPFLVELVRTTFGKKHLPSPDKAPDLVPQRPSPPTLGFLGKMKLKFPFLKKSRQANDVNDPKPSNV